MSITTKNGVVLTDEVLEGIANMFESGEWSGADSRIVRGRPLLLGEDLKSVTFKAPARKVEAMDLKAASLNLSRSDYLRSLVDKDLANV